jgi:uncharacterized protein YabE (DUF348 family)
MAWTTGIGLVLIIFGLVVGLIPPPGHVSADASRIVSLYYDGQEKVISTEAPTVSAALQAAGVQLGQGDMVEPSLDTAIPVGFFNINVYRSRPVVVIDGSTHTTVTTALQSPALIAQQAGLTVYPEDTYSTTILTDVTTAGTIGQEVTIHRATPVILSSDGQQSVVRTQQTTVGALLSDRDVALGPQDTVSPGNDTPITPNMVISINRVTLVVQTQTDAIPHATQNVNDPNLTIGTTQVQTPGSDGQQVSTYRVHYQNGMEQSRQLLTQQVTVAPVTAVVLVGTKIDYSADPVQLGQQLAAARGWTGSEWTALYQLWEHESGWNPSSNNFWSGACGIPQADPCSKISDQSAAGQITWGLNYITGKYGDPESALAYWQAHNSY